MKIKITDIEGYTGGNTGTGGGSISPGHTSWMFYALAEPTGNIQINSLVFLDGSGNPIPIPTSDGQFLPSSTVAPAFDTDPTTFYAKDGSTGSLGYTFTSPVNVTGIRLVADNSNYADRVPTSWIMRWSDDAGTTWNDAWSKSGETQFAHAETRTYMNPNAITVVYGAPPGGTTGQVLAKKSNSPGDFVYANPSMPEPPSDGQKYARQNGAWTTFQEGVNGAKGDAGRGISSTAIDGSNHLIVGYSDNTSADLGNVKGDKGITGAGVAAGGFTGQVLAKINGEDYNTFWTDMAAGGDGTGTANPTLDFPAWGQTIATINQTFDSGTVPGTFVWKNGIAGTIIDDPDAGPSTTKALQFGSGSAGDNADAWFEVPAYADGTNYNVKIRYKTQGEKNYDGFSLNIDGGQVLNDKTVSDSFVEFNTTLTPGQHTLRFRYTSDYTSQAGFENTHFSQILYPGLQSTNGYQHGDTVHHNNKIYLCLTTGTNEEPGTGVQWSSLTPLPVGGVQGQALVKNSSTDNDVSWSTVGGGTSTAGNDMDYLLMRAKLDNFKTLTNTANPTDRATDYLVPVGDDIVMMCFNIMTANDGNAPEKSVNARFTCPTGKKMVVLRSLCSLNVSNNSQFYYHAIWNATTSVEVWNARTGQGAAGGSSGGFADSDYGGPFTSIPSLPVLAVAEGETIEIRANTSGDGNYRTQVGTYWIGLIPR